MQQGMLFHTLLAPESGVYFEQTVFTLTGHLNTQAFQQAWQIVVDRHQILRSAFVWEDLEHPQQIVHRRVSLPFQYEDWSQLSAAEQEEGLARFVAADRSEGFDLATAPLLRLALFRVADSSHRFVFSRHHLLIDRWSRSLILKEAYALYEALAQGQQLPVKSPRPYGDYIAWINQQDREEAKRYWTDRLAGFTAPTAFAIDRKPGKQDGSSEYSDERIFLAPESTERLRNFARENKLTLNILAQSAWAVLLSRYSSDTDVLFGATMSGRPAALEGVESMVGLFINTLPVRVRVSEGQQVLAWLRELQDAQSKLQQFEHSALIDIQQWSDVPRGLPLFESIFVFENLPVGSSYQTGDSALQFAEDRGLGSTTGYPLTILVSPAA